MHILVIGNPENRRVQLFCQAARSLRLSPPKVISYLELLREETQLGEWLRPHTMVRIESPGENFEVEKEIIALGAPINAAFREQWISADEARQMTYDQGRIRYLRQWYQGFAHLLTQWQREVAHVGSIAWMNTPMAIRLMFDKVRCHKHLSRAGVAVPRVLPAIRSYEELRSQLQAKAWQRVFIKPAHSSSASGVVAYRIQGQREQAITSIETVNGSGQILFYNSLRMRRYSASNEIGPLVDFVLREGAIVEEWIPKATLQNQFFDVRVVVIDGKARHVLPRLSDGPITNLHLGNRRGNAERLREKLGPIKYEQLLRLSEEAVTSIPGAFYAGVDVLIPVGSGSPRVLELNAFGDLLPQLLHQGEDTYTTELKALRHANAL